MIIGITGMLGAGKGTVTKYLISKGFKHVAVSGMFLKTEAINRGLEPNRQARHDIANEYRAKGPTQLMEAVYEMARSSIEKGEDVVIEPQHSIDEVKFIQSIGGVVIGVNGDITVRYERIKERGGPKDHVSFEEFKAMEELESRPTEKTTNDLLGSLNAADFVVMNNGTMEELHTQVDEVLEKVIG